MCLNWASPFRSRRRAAMALTGLSRMVRRIDDYCTRTLVVYISKTQKKKCVVRRELDGLFCREGEEHSDVWYLVCGRQQVVEVAKGKEGRKENG